MRVRATANGYGGTPPGRRKVGDEFDMPEGSRGSWFTPVASEPRTAPSGKTEGPKVAPKSVTLA